jgi:hypothetical protein
MAHLPALNRLSGQLIVAAILAKRSAASNGLNQLFTHVRVWRWLTRAVRRTSASHRKRLSPQLLTVCPNSTHDIIADLM